MNAERIEHIEQYLAGELSRTQLEELAPGITGPELEEQITWVRRSQVAIEMAGVREQLQEALPEPASSTNQANVRSLRPQMAIWAVAASVLLILGIFWIIRRPQTPTLYAQYEYVDPGLPVLMSQNEQHQLYDALTYYGEGNYAEAAKRLQPLQAAKPSNDTLAFYLGASWLYLGETEKARTPLLQASEDESSSFQERADWLLVLTALKDKDLSKAKEAAARILETPEHAFFEQANALQQDLDEAN